MVLLILVLLIVIHFMSLICYRTTVGFFLVTRGTYEQPSLQRSRKVIVKKKLFSLLNSSTNILLRSKPKSKQWSLPSQVTHYDRQAVVDRLRPSNGDRLPFDLLPILCIVAATVAIYRKRWSLKATIHRETIRQQYWQHRSDWSPHPLLPCNRISNSIGRKPPNVKLIRHKTFGANQPHQLSRKPRRSSVPTGRVTSLFYCE